MEVITKVACGSVIAGGGGAAGAYGVHRWSTSHESQQSEVPVSEERNDESTADTAGRVNTGAVEGEAARGGEDAESEVLSPAPQTGGSQDSAKQPESHTPSSVNTPGEGSGNATPNSQGTQSELSTTPGKPGTSEG